MSYEEVNIHSFRGITDLKISDMKQINLFVGRNNCGKTTILDAIFLLSGMSNPQVSVFIYSIRGLPIFENNDFRYMFHNLDFNDPIYVDGNINHEKRALIITPNYDWNNNSQNEKNVDVNIPNTQAGISASASKIVQCLNVDFEDNKNQKYHGEINIQHGQTKMITASYPEKLKCIYLTPSNFLMPFDKPLEKLILQKKLPEVISVLKQIYPIIIDIRMGAGGMIYVDIGKDSLVPIHIMGDGIRRILTVLTSIADAQDGVLLIDEIENGLHHSSLSIAWKAYITACRQYNVQLIATTHSYECVQALSFTYNNISQSGDDIRLYRIDTENEKYKALAYTSQMIQTAIEQEFEVR